LAAALRDLRRRRDLGGLTDFVYRDPDKLHLSLATAFLILSPIALSAFALGLGPMRRAVASAETVRPGKAGAHEPAASAAAAPWGAQQPRTR